MFGGNGSHRRLPASDRGHHGQQQTMNGHGPAQQHAAYDSENPAAWPGEAMHSGNGMANGGSAVNDKLHSGAAATAEPRLFSEDADDFLCGTAISVYQNSGGPDSNWGEYENRQKWILKTIAVRDLLRFRKPGLRAVHPSHWPGEMPNMPQLAVQASDRVINAFWSRLSAAANLCTCMLPSSSCRGCQRS